jgi:hypothetical protein
MINILKPEDQGTTFLRRLGELPLAAGLHGVTCQKTVLFIITDVRISNPTLRMSLLCNSKDCGMKMETKMCLNY